MINCKSLSTPMVINEKLSKNNGQEKVDASTYRTLVGSLIYLTTTRSNIMHVVSIVSRFMSEPSKDHFTTAKRILRYIKATRIFGIIYEAEQNYKLRRFTKYHACSQYCFQIYE